MKNVKLDVDHILQWDATACFKASKMMVEEYGKKVGKTFTDLGPHHAIWLAVAEDAVGHITADPKLAKEALEYLNKCLLAGAPVIVGVSHKDSDYNFDKFTDHFVVVRSHFNRTQGGPIYGFLDPATSQAQKESAFEIDSDGILWRPGEDAEGPARLRRYDVSCVRRYREID